MRKVVVTGAGGYIGGRLVDFLVANEWHVETLQRKHSPHIAVSQSTLDLAGQSIVEPLSQMLSGAEAVVHLAGEDEVTTASDPLGALARTVAATQNVAAARSAARVPRLVYVSTVHVYGTQLVPGAILSEDMRVEPRSTYAIARLASEHLAAAADPRGLVVLRLTNCVGAPATSSVHRGSPVVNDLCRQGVTSKRLTLRTSGMQWRDFIPVTTACWVIALAAQADLPMVQPSTYNLGSSQPRTVRSIAQMVQDAFEEQTGERPQLFAPRAEPNPPAPHYVSTDRLRAQGMALSGHVTEAVSETVTFYLVNRKRLG